MPRIITSAVVCLVGLSAIANAADFKITNATPDDYDHLFIAPHGTTRWGPDLAAGKPAKRLDGGKTMIVNDIRPGVYDVKMTDDDDALNICIIKNVSFTTGTVQLTAPAGKSQGHG